jgi:eukaryotic-like serine/threonine-protein kinase
VGQVAETMDMGPCPGCGRPNPPEARFCSGCGHPLVQGEDRGGGVADPLIGRVLADRYRIESLLGRGGMGVVYKVEHVQIGKLMAMKLLHGELARQRAVLKRFRREAEAASKLSHPNTVQIFDFGRAEGLTYLVMEYVDGDDMGQVIKQAGTLDFARAARLCAQVCASVAEAHDHGIVHRDVKPENIMVTQTRAEPDFIKVLDFGLAKLREGGEQANITVTGAGHIVGTPYYMAPEQIRGEDVDPRTDVYAIGAVLYRALTGKPPYWAPSPMGVLTKHLTEPLVPPSERVDARLPAEADAIVMRAMQKDASQRHASATELREELLHYLRAVGEDSGPAFVGTSGVTTLGGRPVAARVAPAEVATRSDVDAFQRRLKRRGWVGYVVLTGLLVSMAAGGWWAWAQRPAAGVLTVEQEPNDTPAEANPLAPGLVLEGHLGKRINRERGDVDVFRLDTPDGQRRVLSVEVTAIPNMDIVLEIARAGRSAPLLEADSGGVGAPERVPNFPIEGTTHYLRVRERWVRGELPTENVSDPYTIRWDVIEPGPEDEREVNDALELANDIGLGERRRGFIGWAGDVDYYCLSQVGGAVMARVSGVPGVDLVLRVIDRAESRSTQIDDGGPGEGERSPRVAAAQAGHTCFAVAASRTSPEASNAEQTYVLEILEGA